jgi:hypothetical protein
MHPRVDLASLQQQALRFASPVSGSSLTSRRPAPAPTAAERVLAAELENRSGSCDALSMMVSSMARMVQVGRSRDSRWKAS